jgi:hypothetical protein
MSDRQPPARRWVSVPEFAEHIGVSPSHAYVMVHTHPQVRKVARRFGRRWQVCLAAWLEYERQMTAELLEAAS